MSGLDPVGYVQSVYGGLNWLYLQTLGNWLFPTISSEGARVNDLRFQGVSEGTPINRAYGRRVRLEGQVIYLGDLIERQNTHSTNGKGGGGTEFVEYTYSCHVAVAICHGPITALKKVWANRKLIWNADSDLNVSSSQLSGTASSTIYSVYGGPQGGWTHWHKWHLKVSSPIGGPDLSIAHVGQSVVLGGTGATNDGTWRVIEAHRNSDESSYLKVERYQVLGFATFAGWSAGAYTVTLFQHIDNFSLTSMDGLSGPYLGTDSQEIDTFFEQLVGTGEWPAHRGVAWVGVRNLQLADSGNTLPQFEFEVEQSPTATVGDAILAECVVGGMDAGEVDVSACSDVTVDALQGYVVRSVQAGLTSIQPLMTAFELFSYESDVATIFVKRADVEVLAVDGSLLAAHGEGSDAPRDVQVVDAPDESIPTEVVVRYVDPDVENQTGTQRDVRTTEPNRVTQFADVPVSLTAARARELSSRILWTSLAWARTLRVTLPPSMVGVVREAMALTFTANGEDWRMIARRVDRGEGHMLVVEGPRDLAHLIESAPDPEDVPSGASFDRGSQRRTFTAQPVELHLLDLPAMRDEHVRTPGLYFAVCGTSPDDGWSGCSVFESIDGGTEYTLVADVRQAASIGASTASASTTAAAEEWDETSVLDVYMTNGELESVTELECLNGANRACYGREVIGFRDVELTAERSYRLTGLLRGLRGTDEAISDHAVGDRFVVLTAPGLQWLSMSLSSVGMQRHYKAVTSGASLDDALAQEHFPTGATVAPFAPVQLAASRSASNDVTLTWVRRTRQVVRLFSAQAVPLVDPFEAYEVDVFEDDTFADVVRTIACQSPSATYTAAQQTADGLTPGDPVSVRVHQVGDMVRRGAALEGTL